MPAAANRRAVDLVGPSKALSPTNCSAAKSRSLSNVPIGYLALTRSKFFGYLDLIACRSASEVVIPCAKRPAYVINRFSTGAVGGLRMDYAGNWYLIQGNPQHCLPIVKVNITLPQTLSRGLPYYDIVNDRAHRKGLHLHQRLH